MYTDIEIPELNPTIKQSFTSKKNNKNMYIFISIITLFISIFILFIYSDNNNSTKNTEIQKNIDEFPKLKLSNELLSKNDIKIK